MFNYEKYRGKKVLITGHTGFKGAWMLAILHKIGAEILGYALDPEFEHCIFNEINGNNKCLSIIGDIRDKSKLEKTILDFAPDYVFHFAAQALVLKSYDFPAETFNVNVGGTATLLEVIKELDKKCSVVVVTTDKVYENKEWEFPYKENDNLGGYDPYSASKACTEIVVSCFRNSFFNLNNIDSHEKAIVSVRAGNVIGGGDYSKNRIIPDVVKALSHNEKIILRNPSAIRPWQHVLEPLFVYLKLGLLLNDNPEKYSRPFNVGPNTEDVLTVEELVKKAIDVWGAGEYAVLEKSEFHEAGILKLDVSLAKKLLKWRPVYNSSEAVSKTIQWYKHENKVEITNEQIEEYLNEIS